MKPIILIPARLASTRLPNKPLADIGGAPMIVQVWRRAMEADLGPVCVAAGDPEIVEAVRAAGGEAVETDPNHPSGSDRIFEALSRLDPDGTHDVVINLQGDLPTINPATLRAVALPLEDPAVDISTLAVEIVREDEKTNPNVTKAVVSLKPGAETGRALYFTRATAPTGDGPIWHHIGIYGYRRAALERFVALPPSPLEQRERLEQLRALEDGMVIGVAIVGEVPAGVDTPEDLELAREELREKGK
ncbi:MAG: 3-deoxy-manno-octulosonate cytidylyltransferase [Alphaproteobacteria bacterium]|nr:MAG: 3-deoxy-manno-octulosonate cytidylyltransferase [Alphaproteobacteria bacterium]